MHLISQRETSMPDEEVHENNTGTIKNEIWNIGKNTTRKITHEKYFFRDLFHHSREKSDYDSHKQGK